MNSKMTMSAVNAAAMSSACGSGIGSCTVLGMNMRIAPASITSEPITASLPSAFASHAPVLAEMWPSAPRLTVIEYQSRNSAPISVATVPATTIHWLREPCDQSIVTLLGKTTKRKPALVRRCDGDSSATLQRDEERRKERDALPERFQRDAFVHGVGARSGRAEAVDHRGADGGGEVPVRPARRGVLGQAHAGVPGDGDRRAHQLGRAGGLHHRRPRHAAADLDDGALVVRPQAADRLLQRALAVGRPGAGVDPRPGLPRHHVVAGAAADLTDVRADAGGRI